MNIRFLDTHFGFLRIIATSNFVPKIYVKLNPPTTFFHTFFYSYSPRIREVHAKKYSFKSQDSLKMIQS